MRRRMCLLMALLLTLIGHVVQGETDSEAVVEGQSEFNREAFCRSVQSFGMETYVLPGAPAAKAVGETLEVGAVQKEIARVHSQDGIAALTRLDECWSGKPYLVPYLSGLHAVELCTPEGEWAASTDIAVKLWHLGLRLAAIGKRTYLTVAAGSPSEQLTAVRQARTYVTDDASGVLRLADFTAAGAGIGRTARVDPDAPLEVVFSLRSRTACTAQLRGGRGLNCDELLLETRGVVGDMEIRKNIAAEELSYLRLIATDGAGHRLETSPVWIETTAGELNIVARFGIAKDGTLPVRGGPGSDITLPFQSQAAGSYDLLLWLLPTGDAQVSVILDGEQCADVYRADLAPVPRDVKGREMAAPRHPVLWIAPLGRLEADRRYTLRLRSTGKVAVQRGVVLATPTPLVDKGVTHLHHGKYGWGDDPGGYPQGKRYMRSFGYNYWRPDDCTVKDTTAEGWIAMPGAQEAADMKFGLNHLGPDFVEFAEGYEGGTKAKKAAFTLGQIVADGGIPEIEHPRIHKPGAYVMQWNDASAHGFARRETWWAAASLFEMFNGQEYAYDYPERLSFVPQKYLAGNMIGGDVYPDGQPDFLPDKLPAVDGRFYRTYEIFLEMNLEYLAGCRGLPLCPLSNIDRGHPAIKSNATFALADHATTAGLRSAYARGRLVASSFESCIILAVCRDAEGRRWHAGQLPPANAVRPFTVRLCAFGPGELVVEVLDAVKTLEAGRPVLLAERKGNWFVQADIVLGDGPLYVAQARWKFPAKCRHATGAMAVAAPIFAVRRGQVAWTSRITVQGG